VHRVSFDEPRHPQGRPLGLRDLWTAWSGEAQRKRTAMHVRHVLSNEMADKKSQAGSTVPYTRFIHMMEL
jgi:hypothetical protein